MRAHYALDQRRDDRRGPGCKFACFQMHVNLATQIRKRGAQVCCAGRKTVVHDHDAILIDDCLLKGTRPQIESDVNFVHADVSSFWLLETLKGTTGLLSRRRHLLLETYLKARTFIVPLDRSGGCAFCIIIGPAEVE